MSQVISLPISQGPEVQLNRWMVVIFNDDHTPFDVVIFTLMIATNCSREEAELETWEAHHIGRASVHFASEEECLAVADVIRRAGVKVEVCAEWKD
jgi:ATP-dependent Clp protease adapter protein ClpS